MPDIIGYIITICNDPVQLADLLAWLMIWNVLNTALGLLAMWKISDIEKERDV